MPTQEVARAAGPSALLQCGERRRHPVLLDGGGPDSWGCGEALYSPTRRPRRWRCFPPAGAAGATGGAEAWRWGEPLAQWEAFLAAGAPSSVRPPGAAGFLTVLELRPQALDRSAAAPARRGRPAGALLRALRLVLSRRLPHVRTSLRLAARAPRARSRYERTASARRRSCHRTRAGHGRPATVRARDRACCSARTSTSQCSRAPTTTSPPATSTGQPRAASSPPIRRATTRRRCSPPGRERYPMPFAAYVDGGAWVVVSNSPECFLLADGERGGHLPDQGHAAARRRRTDGARAASCAATPRSAPSTS